MVAENTLVLHGFHPDGDFKAIRVEEDENTVRITVGVGNESVKLNSDQMDLVRHFLKESSNNA